MWQRLLAIAGVLLGAGALLGAESAKSAGGLEIGPAQVRIDGQPAETSSSSEFGFLLLYRPGGSQAALMRGANRCVVSCTAGQAVEIVLPLTCHSRESGNPYPLSAPRLRFTCRALGLGPGPVKVAFVWRPSANQTPPAQSEKPSASEWDPNGFRWQTIQPGQSVDLEASLSASDRQGEIVLIVRTPGGNEPGGLRWEDLRWTVGGGSAGTVGGGSAGASLAAPTPTQVRSVPIPIWARPADPNRFPPPELPTPHPAIQKAMIEWDWRMQDGLDTPRCPSTLAEAIQNCLDRGDLLVADLQAAGMLPSELAEQWKPLRPRFAELRQTGWVEGPEGQALWLQAHRLRRQIALANPLFPRGPIVFVKHPHSIFSHQLTQYTGNCARPGGGLFVLEKPGQSMDCRSVTTGKLPVGSYQFADVSYDGRRILFSYSSVDRTPPNREVHLDKHFHLYEIQSDGTGLRQLTSGPYDDFAGRYLPDGRIVFVSTRRGGFHRCGQGPCPVHTLALCEADGSNPRIISYHETHEWDPAVLGDGRLIYTRWDYVDRNAVFYQQLWTVRPDGTDVRIFYGNNTFNPVGIWEAQAVPGSPRVMATAAAHHAMTAGSVILVDVRRGVDGSGPIERLTPDALFPESEMPVIRGDGRPIWHNPVGVISPPPAMEDHRRWPGACYKSPWPISETYFLVAYSFDRLIGEPDPCPANMFGLYWVDRFGNKELLYRDLNISSLWPVPLRPRPRPPVIPSQVASGITSSSGLSGEVGGGGSSPLRRGDGATSADRLPISLSDAPSGPQATWNDPAELAHLAARREGLFFLQDVYRSWPALPAGVKISRLRVVQVLPKSTWHINQPTVGLPNASPGRQVLGTVSVESDGSALFSAPAGLPLAFQALDELGQAVQTMRSITYLQPGEVVSCVGCHEPRDRAPEAASARMPLALRREPSRIQPGPEGSKPFSYPLLVQPVLDKHCLRCHNPEKKDGGIVLSGQPEGRYTVSYNVLAPRVPYSAWGGKPGDFRQVNSEPMTRPDFFGARASALVQLLRRGHYEVKLSAEEWDRLITWMDTNALFYGTFDPAGQARQQQGQRIPGPALE